MKKFVLATVAASVALAPALAAAAPAPQHRQTVRHVVKTGPNRVVQRTVIRTPQPRYRSWQRGQRFDRRYARNYTVIRDTHRYRLRTPPRGYQWVRSNNDAVLVAITSGIIASVLANAIR